jgi:aspartyl-tRNA(Asn)/glutamyl-tRNA(Gln) amidotransferase subunit B
LNAKTEIKNLNSFRNVARALAWEIKRQARLLEGGGCLEQATRLWDASEGRTRIMRTKEEAHDYRYFPEPDLLPLLIDDEWVQEVGGSLPELPREKETRFVREHELSLEDAVVLAATQELADYFEAVAATAGDGKAAANWVMTEVMHLIKESPEGFEGLRVEPTMLGKMVGMIQAGTISGKIGKVVFAEMALAGGDPEIIVEEKGLVQIHDPALLRQAVEEALDSNPGPLMEYLKGKDTAMQFFIGQVMRLTQGRANPQAARAAVQEALDARRNAEES